jgi:acetoin utilization deacetylase AcuC-like enzyme
MKVFYSPEYVLARHAFETTRKPQWVAESLLERPIAGVETVAPESLTEAQAAAVHDPAYVAAVRTGSPRALAESQGFPWDPALWRMVLASNGGAVAAALAARADGVSGSLSSGLHHARRERGAGFCTFNGLALAADAALAAGAASILILDLDAHGGGGTHSLLADEPRIWQMDVAVDPFDAYTPTERHLRELVRDPGACLPIIERRLDELERVAPAFDLCLYNAGMDPHEGCAIGGLPGITRDVLARREEIVFSWCRRRDIAVAFVLAGGYAGPRLSQAELVELHRLTIAAACMPAT